MRTEFQFNFVLRQKQVGPMLNVFYIQKIENVPELFYCARMITRLATVNSYK